MSSKGRKDKLNPHEHFPTPAWMIHRLMERITLPRSAEWLEPCAGNGDIIKAINEHGQDKTLGPIIWHANEIRTECEAPLKELTSRTTISNFLEWDVKKAGGTYDVIITNPPFSLAMPIIEKSLTLADHVVMLLRLNFVGSTARYEFFKSNMPDIYVIPERPSFNGKGADSIEYCFAHWNTKSTALRPTGRITMLGQTPLHIRNACKPKVYKDNAD